MKSFAAVAAFVAAANAYAYNTTSVAPPAYETITTSEYTTVCPGPTEIPIGPSSTITVTEATTLTITNCPCTITKPVAPTETPGYTPPAPVAPSSAPAPYYPPGNSSAPYVPAPTATGVPTSVYPTGTPSPSEFPGAGAKTGLSLLAVAGALAAFL
jgi:hypothetical protein